MFLAGFGIPAEGEAFVGNGVEFVAVNQHRLFVGALFVLPEEPSRAIGGVGGCLVFRKASAGEDRVLIPNNRAAGAFGNVRRFPEKFSRKRILADDF